MEYDYSLSFHEGDGFSLEHDNRKKLTPNVDKERIKENIVYEGNIPLQKFYEETFQKAYEEYIQKQIKNRHADRVKDWPPTYYEFIRKKQMEQEKVKQQMKIDKKHIREIHGEDKYQRVAKQIIVQVGNIDDFENLLPEQQDALRQTMKSILKEYMESFQKENPSFRIVNAVIHCDEVSLSPHLHLTYVPVSKQTRGQTIQNSLNGALKSMGFITDKKKDDNGVWLTAQMKWQKKERERIIDIAKKHNLHIGYESGRKSRTRSLQDYQRDRQKEREDTLKAREENISDMQEKLSHREKAVVNKETEIKQKINAVNAHIRTETERINKEDKILNNKKINLDKKEKQLEEREEILQDEAQRSIEDLRKAITDATNNLKPTSGKRANEYPAAKLKKGCRIVPEDELDNLISRTWFNPEFMKKKMQKVIEKFNELPFVEAARQQIYNLENQILSLKEKIQKLKKKNQEQEVLLDKAKEININGRSMYDILTDEVNKDYRKIRKEEEQQQIDYGSQILNDDWEL